MMDNTDTSTGRQRKTIVVLVVCFVVGVAALGVALVNHAANDPYCESLDPAGCAVEVTMRNDTGNTYIIKQCSGTFRTSPCRAFADTFTLYPSQSRSAIGTSQNAPEQPWMVFDQADKTVGCLNLHYTKDVQPPVMAPLSKLGSCKPFL